jgi:4-hydroxy-tetrahydrodipicolinate synthase
MLNGVFTALATPMQPNGAIDTENLVRLVQAQLRAGVHGVVLLGTTAETATLTAEEKEIVLKTCVPLLKGKAKMVIGTGTNNTLSTLENTQQAKTFAPDAVLVVTPYYNKPNPSGLVAHYRSVAEIGLPVVLYHIPGRTGLKLSAAVLEKLLREVPQIAAIKESDYDIAQVTDTALKYRGRMDYLCGNDDLFLSFLALQSSGIISAAANVLAPAFVKIYQAFTAGDTHTAQDIFAQIYPLIKTCYAETNPTCIKYMLAKRGYGSDKVRLPLGEISAENKQKIDALLQQAPKAFLIEEVL